MCPCGWSISVHKIPRVEAIHQRVQQTAEPSTVIQTVGEVINPSSSLFRRESTSFQKFASSTLEVTRPSTIDPRCFLIFLFPRPLVDPFSYRVSTVLNVGGDYFVINNVGPTSSIPQFLQESPRYHSSCQSHSSPAVLADAGDILAHPPAYKINKTHYLTVKPAFQQSLTVLLCVLESLSGMPDSLAFLLCKCQLPEGS